MENKDETTSGNPNPPPKAPEPTQSPAVVKKAADTVAKPRPGAPKGKPGANPAPKSQPEPATKPESEPETNDGNVFGIFGWDL